MASRPVKSSSKRERQIRRSRLSPALIPMKKWITCSAMVPISSSWAKTKLQGGWPSARSADRPLFPRAGESQLGHESDLGGRRLSPEDLVAVRKAPEALDD